MRILEGAADLPTWDAETLQEVVVTKQRLIPELHAEWDVAAGEEWCLIASPTELVAAIRAPTSVGRARRFAFVLARSEAGREIRAVVERADGVIVQTDDFDAASS